MPAGSIIIDLLMRTGAFETDTDRAAKKLKAFQASAAATASTLKGELVGALAAAGISLSLNALVNAAGDFKDLEEQVGSTAEELASLAVPAAVAGKSVADLATDMNRLTKNLTGVDDESKAAGAALSALGIPLDEFKKLDPVGQIDALSKAFNSFADGSAKTAVAMALFGKNGASMLSVFKELEAEGGRQVILTQQQIELADEYGDRQKKLTATIKAYAESSAVDLLPALNLVTSAARELVAELVGIDEGGKKLAGDSPLKAFADAAVSLLGFVVDSAQGVTRVLRTVATGIIGASDAMNEARQLNFGAAKSIAKQTVSDIDAILSEELFSQRVARLRAAADAAALPDPNQSAAESARLRRKPTLNFSGASTGSGSKDKTSEAERYLETLQKQAEKTLDLTTYEQALLDIQQKRIKGLTPELERQILAQAQFNDLNKQAIDLRTAEVEALTKRSKAQLDELDSLTKSNAELQKEVDLLGLTKEEQTAYELQQIRIAKALKQRELAQASANLADEGQTDVLEAQIDALTKREQLLSQKGQKEAELAGTKDLKEAVRDNVADGYAEGLLEGGRRGKSLAEIFLSELKAQFAKQVLSPVIKPVLDVQNDIVSQFLKLFGVSNSTMSIDTSGYSYAGATLPNSLRGGADTGTNLVERDMVTLLHKGEAVVPKAYNPAAGGAGSGPIQIVNNTGVQATGREEQDRQPNGTVLRRIVLDAVTDNMAKGGKVARAAMSRLGTGPGVLPRRS